MSVNAASARIARETGRSYHEVRIAINRLVSLNDMLRYEAEAMVEKLARTDCDLEATLFPDLEERINAKFAVSSAAPEDA